MGAVRKIINKSGKPSWQIDYIDPLGKRVRQTFKKKKDADEELGKRVSLIGENRYLDVKKEYLTTLGKLILKYKENHKHQPSFKTAKKYLIDHIETHFGKDTLMANIRYIDLETYRNHLRDTLTFKKTIRKEASINRAMSCLRHLFRKAVEWEMMEQSPFDKGKSLMLKENNMRTRFLTEDEIKNLLSQCNGYLHDIVVCALNTGMRRGEILSLKWSQIRNGFLYLRETKTKEPRQIPVNDDLKEMFDRIKKERKAQTKADKKVVGLNGKPIKDQPLNAEYVFLYRGREIVDNIKRSFNSAKVDASIEDFHFLNCAIPLQVRCF
ncbi:MAG: tyrosine-type recombinase/integrase [Deltaproteobacteria bacterium]|nr:tyrosine-type recombinase/integrase [Deltaproteobacteria bacterium]